MWDAFQKDYIKTYYYQLLYTEYEQNELVMDKVSENSKKSQEKISPIVRSLALNHVSNTILFRTGIYIILILIIVIKYFDKKLIISLIPSILNTMTLLLTMHHQSYRYVMYIQLIFILMLLYINKQEVKK